MLWSNYLYAALFILVGFLLAKIFSRQCTAWLETKFKLKNSVIVQRLIFYGIMSLFTVMALRQMGVELGVLLGAAGILSVAVGFASKTSMSNVISGLFLLGEGAVSVGDTIKVGSVIGEVIGIDWLAIKLRTPENLFVRLPNETLINSEMTNFTRFKIRRFDLYVGVAYKEDIANVKTILQELVTNDNQCLVDPEPLVLVDGFGDSGVNIRLAVWAKSEDFLKFKSNMNEKVKAAFDTAGIEIPFPHISLYAGEKTNPIPVEVFQKK